MSYSLCKSCLKNKTPFRISNFPSIVDKSQHGTVFSAPQRLYKQPMRAFSRSRKVSLYHQQGDVSRSGFPGATGQTTTEMIL